jgi:hypothetical protein
MDQAILDHLYSNNNPFQFATLNDISEGHIYFRSIVTLPGADVLKNTYCVLFKVPMNPEIFSGQSYKEVKASDLKDYYLKIVPVKLI